MCGIIVSQPFHMASCSQDSGAATADVVAVQRPPMKLHSAVLARNCAVVYFDICLRRPTED